MPIYTRDIPQPGDNPSNSQDQILQNFQTLNDLYGTSGDHYPWTNTSANVIGRHAKVTMPGLPTAGSAPGTALPAPNAGEGSIFSQTVGSQTTPFYTRDGLGAVAPLTNIWPLMPIKAFATFTDAGVAAATINLSYNITSITRINATDYVIVITNAMRTAAYGVLSLNTSGFPTRYSIPVVNPTTTFTLTSSVGIFGGPTFTVIVLEP